MEPHPQRRPQETAPAAQESRPRLLVVDDDPVNLKNVARFLKRRGHAAQTASGGKEALRKIRKGGVDLVLTDLVMEEVDGLQVLEQVRKLLPDSEVILMTGYASVSTAIEAIKKGAFHYLQKPIQLEELLCLVENALEKVELRRQVRRLTLDGAGEIHRIIGQSRPILKLKALLPQIAATDSNILITGESGTGKERVARAIHQLSPRAGKRFLAVNCASFTEELLANELFGHEREAYTGATSARPGLLESAHGGTLFFDELGDMPLAMQAKLLRVIQERELLRVGGVTPVAIDVRIIGATNKDLKRSVQAGQFRQDLYYRLHVVPLHMPSLAERREDIPLLAAHFLARLRMRSGSGPVGFSPEAVQLLERYDYPGNVRELENIVERSAAFARQESILPEDLPADIAQMDVFSIHREPQPLRSLEELEREYIHWVMRREEHNKSRAARILGIDRVSLYRKLKKHQIQED